MKLNKWFVVLALGATLMVGCSKQSSNSDNENTQVEAPKTDAAKAQEVEAQKSESEAKKLEEAKILYESADALIKTAAGAAPAEAIESLWKASNAGYPPAMRDLGSFLATTADDEKTILQGVELMKKALDLGDIQAAAELVAHYDHIQLKADDPVVKLKNQQSMVEYAKQAKGILLGCRILFENLHHEDDAIRTTCEQNFSECMAKMPVEREKCETMQIFIDRDSEFSKLDPTIKRMVGESMVGCYTRVIEAGDNRVADEAVDYHPTQNKIDALKADEKYAWSK